MRIRLLIRLDGRADQDIGSNRHFRTQRIQRKSNRNQFLIPVLEISSANPTVTYGDLSTAKQLTFLSAAIAMSGAPLPSSFDGNT